MSLRNNVEQTAPCVRLFLNVAGVWLDIAGVSLVFIIGDFVTANPAEYRIEALRSLAASIALKKNLMVSVRLSPI
jgi:hypothetical protein